MKTPRIAVAACIFLIALLVRITVIVATQEYKGRSRGEIHRIALSVARGEGFSNPYLLPTGPTAHSAPGYPLLLALVYKIAGTEQMGELGMFLFQSVFASLLFASLPGLSLTLGLPAQTGILAGIIGAAVPVHYRQEFQWGEMVFSALFLVRLLDLTARTFQERDYRLLAAFRYGLWWGVALLFAPSLLPIGIGWMALLVFSERLRVPVLAIRYCLVALSTAWICILPWMVRNYLVLGSPIPFRSNLGLELQVSNNDFARSTLFENQRYGEYTQLHPLHSIAQAALVQQQGEVSYNAEKMRQAITWMRARPFQFLRLTAVRSFYFWFPRTDHPIQSIFLWMITFVAGFGFLSLVSASHSAGQLLGCILLAYPLIYYIVQSDTRYRYPLYCTFLLLASLGILHLRDIILGLQRRSSEKEELDKSERTA